MRRLFPLVLAFPLLLGVNCDAITGTDSTERFYYEAGRVVLENRGVEGFFTIAYSDRLAPLIDWYPCIQAPECGYVAPGSARRYTLEDLHSGVGDVIWIYYWRAVLGPGGQMQAGPVTLRKVRITVQAPMSITGGIR